MSEKIMVMCNDDGVMSYDIFENSPTIYAFFNPDEYVIFTDKDSEEKVFKELKNQYITLLEVKLSELIDEIEGVKELEYK